MARTYTGPTAAGGRATVECPDWCTTDHAYWEDRTDDMFHRADPVELVAPRDRGGSPGLVLGGASVPLLEVTLALYSSDPRPAAASVWLARDETTGNAVELGLPGVDVLLDRLDAFRAQLAGIREHLAAIDKDRRRAA